MYQHLIVAIVAISVLRSSATTIVLIRTPKHVVVGADSLMVDWQKASSTPNSCSRKIHKQGKIFFTISGMGVVYPGSGFSAERLGRLAVERSASMEEASRKFARVAVGPYAQVMQAMQLSSPHDWNLVKQYRGNGITLVIVFFGMEKGISKYVAVGLRVSIGKRIIVTANTASCPGTACEDDRDTKHAIIIGQSEAAYRHIGGAGQGLFRRFQGKRSDPEIARSIIAIEEQSVPSLVGGPIQVLTVDALGEHWDSFSRPCS
jgi:hypothetical protein